MQNFTISIYTENNIGLLNRISAIFQKRHINITSINASESEIKDVYRFTIVAPMTSSQVKKIIGQIEKQIEVIKAYYHKDDELIYHQTALYKIDTKLILNEASIQKIISKHNANINFINSEFTVIEKKGRSTETQDLYHDLVPFGIMQFVRSGRIAISKEIMPISDILNEFNQN